MKSESVHIVEQLYKNPQAILGLEEPQIQGNMVVVPITLKGSLLDFISMTEAEEKGLITIKETEQVNNLEIFNKSNQLVLIPFGTTVKGGKQDRTIWESILLPAESGSKVNGTNRNYVVPAKCVEQSRWKYKGGGKGFKSAKTRLHPNLAYAAQTAGGQGAVWNEIQSHRAEMSIAGDIAPTQNYLEMMETIEKDTEKIVNKFKNVKDQCGIAVFINGEFIGMEFYANVKAWSSMSEDIIKAFSVEALRFKDKPTKKVDGKYSDIITRALKELKMDFSVRKGVGLGNVVDFNSEDEKWRGNTLVHEDIMVQFYLVSKRGGATESSPVRLQRQDYIQQMVRNF
jgi:hypothetical protein